MVEAVDGFKRRIDYLRLSITDRCNLRCTYCMPATGIKHRSHDEILSYEEMERFARLAIESGLSKIRLTGGEPLVRRDCVDLVAAMVAIPDCREVSITTNGLLLPRFARPLADAGLHRVNISIDSLDPDIFRQVTRGGELKDALAGMEAALEAGLEPVKINVVAIRQLNQDFEAFAQLTRDYPVHVRFIEYMPVGSREIWTENDYISAEEIKATLEPLGIKDDAVAPTGWGPAKYVQMEGAQGTIGFIKPRSSHFCPECNRLRLTADGRLRLCLFSDVEIDVRSALRSGASDEEIKDLIRQALRDKPRARPEFGGTAPEGGEPADETFEGTNRGMSQIGG